MRIPVNIKKLIIALGIITLITASFFTCLVIFLPKIVSSEKFKDLLDRQASNALNRGLQIDEITWAWSDDLLIKNIRIVDDPAFSTEPILTVRSARAKVFLGDLLDGRLRFDCTVDGINAGFIRSKSERTNIGMLLAQILQVEAKK